MVQGNNLGNNRSILSEILIAWMGVGVGNREK